jgi:hypothetical protein
MTINAAPLLYLGTPFFVRLYLLKKVKMEREREKLLPLVY